MNGRYLMGQPFCDVKISYLDVECMVDTGFDGALMLPCNDAMQLGLQPLGSIGYLTADGKVRRAQTFAASVDWLGKKLQTAVICTDVDMPLLGMGLLRYARTIMEPAKRILDIMPAGE